MLYTEIINNLYLGSYSDVINNTYKEENIKLIINVAKECKKIEQNINYSYYNYEDSPSSLISDKFDEIADLIHSYLIQNKKVFIHCMAGKSRSASFVIIYLVKYLNYSLNYAYDYVNNLRDIYPNLGFVEQMIEYEYKTTNNKTLCYDKMVIENISYTFPSLSKDKIKTLYKETNKNIDDTINKIFSII
jgi:protein-tyrosine phosphatase